MAYRKLQKIEEPVHDVEVEVAAVHDVEVEVAAVHDVEVEVAAVHDVEVDDEFITVKAVGSNQYEPFQRIPIPADYGVPVKMSSWVRVQLDAGVIVQC